MSFSQALSGLNAQQQKLGAVGNNIANSQTVGFKSSEVQFADVYAQSRIGLGTRVSATLQNFSQGNIESSSRNMDLAIAGEGFFRFEQPGGGVGYSRNGQLTMQPNGDLVNAQGARIMGYAANELGEVQAGGDVEALNVDAGDLAASATTQLDASLNLDAEVEVINGDSVYLADDRVAVRGDGTGPTSDNQLYYIEDDPDSHGISGPVFDIDGNNITVGGNNVLYDGNDFVEENTGNDVDGFSKVEDSQIVFSDADDNYYSLDDSDPPQLFDSGGNGAQEGANNIYYNETTGEFFNDTDFTSGDVVTYEQGAGFVTTAAGEPLQALMTTPTLDAGDSNTYNYSTNATVFDSLGNARNLSLYFTKLESPPYGTGQGSAWKVDARLSGGPEGAPSFERNLGDLDFDQSGRLSDGGNKSVSIDLGDEFELLEFDMSFAGSTQFANNSTVNDINQDGYTSGSLVGVTIEDDGTIMRNYSNEQSLAAGQIALVSFRNPEGLKPEGDNLWSATGSSGQELVGAAGTGQRGLIEASAIETSNVDLAGELVDMIVSQRAYQANSQTISTQDELLQTIINL
ncbi:flagellar hook-basal body complex protein [Halomonas alkaliantarctica]|nr:flagellar hook-basal body complex protein [Halomonas alkaliantarctica]